MTTQEILDQYMSCESTSELISTVPRLADELRRLHAENESLRKDAGRYQWLKENGYYVDDDEFMPHIEYGLFVHTDRSIKSIDEAIDAAMGEGK